MVVDFLFAPRPKSGKTPDLHCALSDYKFNNFAVIPYARPMERRSVIRGGITA